jgi:hypothetical protein
LLAAYGRFLYLSKVKRVIAFFLVSIYMMSFSELHQFLKLPILVQHFVEHQKKDPSISLLAFLEEHYVHQYIVDDDYQRDKELPFREGDCVVNNSITCECHHPVIELPYSSTEVKHEFVWYNEKDKPLVSVADIFQPPRFTAI